MTMENPPRAGAMPGSFWTFSLAVYARPGVPEACLALQDGYGLDVNVLLFALYAAQHGAALDTDAFEDLDGAVANWRRQVVAPLRAIRRHVKTTLGDGGGATRAGKTPTPASVEQETYEAIKRAELSAERAQQCNMEQWLAARPGTAAPVQADAGDGFASDARVALDSSDALDAATIDTLGAANLDAYLAHMQCPCDANAQAFVQVLLAAVSAPRSE
ncbi:TIGR02444 family protein [Bordetella genomosp. 8]|uniref:TIGR02444 family protein n=1 Tax=Bordetella genomosp. 8 TaxID=1416806 RepID=A0A1W6YFY8_9BORD|nr:TIGR02444 family protein [Bordetella genomosp. 8]ARP80016.1 TIGR02444 family protein [Bordetella genomosp. 8]